METIVKTLSFIVRLSVAMTAFLLSSTVSVGQTLDSQATMLQPQVADSIADNSIAVSGRDWSTWKPKPKKALILAAVLPGAGQIYNRKFWKLPIIYGGFVGCIYAIRWNSMMYDDYSQAYLDIMDDDPNTHSYNQFLHLGTEINDDNTERYANIFKRRKDYYRRYRDLSYIVLVGVYALQIVDAFVDASLSDFDISSDLSMSVAPTVINLPMYGSNMKTTALGIRCCINF